MPEWLKSTGQALAGAGIFIAAITYLFTTLREVRRRITELRGILALVSTEIDSHQGVLYRYLSEPQRILSASSDALKTRVWSENRALLAQQLSTEDFSWVAGYYGNVEQLKEDLQHAIYQSEKIEELLRYMEVYVQQGTYVKDRLRQYITRRAGEAGK